MSNHRLLVITSVHRPDDPRIRAKLIPSLAADWDVTYATADPGPSDDTGLTWIRLSGGRLRRWLGGTRHILARGWGIVAVHDPELLPGALVRGMLGRPTVFDLHENLPALFRTRGWVPGPLRSPLSLITRALLRLSERLITITLAEAGYQGLFRRDHPVIANHLPPQLPEPGEVEAPPFLVYLGDITEERGAFLALEAAAGAGQRLVMIGRVSPPRLADRLQRRARELGVDIDLVGELAHPQALARIVGASAGLSPLLDVENYRHSLPTKVPEYLALGLPVLASDLPGTRLPTERFAGMRFVAPGDAGAWREAGAALAADPGWRRRARDELESVRAAFSWSEARVRDVYRRAARR